MAPPKAAAAGSLQGRALSAPRSLSGRRLRQLLARGDQRAFEQVFRQHHREIYRYCLGLTENRGDAEDALQATMAAALRSLPGDERDIELRPWLFRVAHNESISIIRGRRETPQTDIQEEPGALHSESPEEARERSARLRSLVEDLRNLPERQRSALVMRELSDLSYEEIGAALDCGEGAARQTVHEARASLAVRKEGREMSCESVMRAIDDHDRRRLRGRKIRAHLAACPSCAGFERAIEARRSDLRALCPPLPVAAAGGMLAALTGAGSAKAAVLGGGAGASAAAGTGGGIGAAAGGSAATAAAVGTAAGAGVAGSVVLKGAAVVAAITVAAGAADGVGAIDLPGPVEIGAGGKKPPAASTGPASETAGPEVRLDGRPGSAEAEGARGRGIAASRKREANGQGRPAGRRPGKGRGRGNDSGGRSNGRGKGQTEGKANAQGNGAGTRPSPPGQSKTPPGQSQAPPGQSTAPGGQSGGGAQTPAGPPAAPPASPKAGGQGGGPAAQSPSPGPPAKAPGGGKPDG